VNRGAPDGAKRILVTNDDGIDAPGIAALCAVLSRLGDVTVAAPDREHSGASHALTFRRPLRVRKHSERRYAIDGTPTDCVHLAVFQLVAGGPPDLVVSGINRGYNLGDDVTYSGTVAGALEGTLLRVPSLAISAGFDAGEPDYDVAARVAAGLCTEVLRRGLAPGTFLNVNVPPGRPCGIRVTRQGSRTYRAAVVERTDPKGEPYYWIAAADAVPADEADGDHVAVRDRYVSVTPLHADLTHVPSLAALSSWNLEIVP